MKESRAALRRLAEGELRRDLDFYVESYGVHTCQRLEEVRFLLDYAGWTGLHLLTAWAGEQPAGRTAR